MQRQLASILRHLRRVVIQRTDGGLSDAQLLERFARQRDEAAFEVMVWRHGPMVLGVARRVLGNLHDAEDVLQATFLALVRQARSISRRESLGAWLYRVAYRTALRARKLRQKRAAEPLVDAAAPEPVAEDAGFEALALLDEELQRLPEKYRTPLVLSYLQGLANREIAAELGCPVGTIFTRLARGREMLRLRLVRRGVTLSTAALATALVEAAPTALSADIVKTTVRAAMTFAAGSAAAVAPHVAALTEGVLRMIWVSKLKLIAGVLVLAAAAGSGASLLTYRAAAREREESKKEAAAQDKPAEEPRRPPREALRYGGKSFEEWRNLMLTELKPESRVEAIKAMSSFGANGYAREAAAAIAELLRGYDPGPAFIDRGDAQVVEAADIAFSKIGVDAGPALVEELAKGNRRSRLHALNLLPGLGIDRKEVLPAVIKAAEAGDPMVRCQALKTLFGQDSDNAHVAVITKAAADKNTDVRYTAINLLAELGARAKEAMPQLLAAAEDVKNPGIRARALTALGNLDLNAQKVVPILRKALLDDKFEVQMAAVQPVAKLGTQAKDLLPQLVELLKKVKKPEDKIAIVRALGRTAATDAAFQSDLVKLLEDELSQATKNRFGPATLPDTPLQEVLKQTLERIKK